MPSTHSALDYHIVFSTKHREPVIRAEWLDEVHRFIGGCVKELGGVPAKVGGTADHVHLAAGLRPKHCLSDILCQVKSDSSAWLQRRFGVKNFHWQEGYGAFTFGRRDLPDVVEYISTQQDHHRIRTFQEEYREFLESYGVEFDERYLW